MMDQPREEDMRTPDQADVDAGEAGPVFDLDSDSPTPVDADADTTDTRPDEELTDAELIIRLEDQRDEMKAKWMRALADFRNYQNRAYENEKQAREDGRTSIVRALMPALDNLDLALAQQDTGTPAEQLVSGMQAVAGQLREIFGGVGVTVVRPEPGDAFDPHLHQAVLQSPSLEVKPGCVMNVIQSGYMLGERVLRPAGVIVATEPSAEMREQAEAAGDGNADQDAAG
jgi:molecular chaperone GrpE